MYLKPYYEDLNNLHVNTMPHRSYYTPYRKNGECAVKMLNGDDWWFKFHSNRFEVDENFTHGNVSGFDTITVPSCWNMLGYDNHHYANVDAPLPFIPPYVPDENPCGAYVKEVSLNNDSLTQKTYLNFDGVDSCFYLYINGDFVGYSQVAHATSEFDVTEYLKEGRNIIAVLVLKWCDGTYLEDQDKFRMSGIFRDVYLIHRPHDHIRDFTVQSFINEDYSKATINVNFEWLTKPMPFTVTLIDPNGETVFLQTNFLSGEINIDVEKPILWNAEQPFLYSLTFATEQESITQKVGIKNVYIKDAVLYINGKNVKIKGVNRHDSDAVTGYTISKKQLRADLRLMKEHNINAIRTSHYPSSPWAYDMYSEYGFYVMTEADFECHNAMSIYGGGHLYNSEIPFVEDYSFGDLCHDPKFYDAILNRIKACVIRDKNSACIFMYSLGNESGYGPNVEKAARWIKDFNNALIHYESSVYQKVGYINDVTDIDVYSRMYISPHTVRRYCENVPQKPILLCEYSHSMGNSNGDLEEHNKTMYEFDTYAGGFVWEWCDHAIYMGKTEDGKERYFYGGDFGESPSDGNFCLDGMITPARKVKSGLLEYKNVYRPIRATLLENGEIRFKNLLDFANVADEFDVEIIQIIDNRAVKTDVLSDLNINPGETVDIKFDYINKLQGDNYLLIKYLQKCDKPLTAKGYEVGFDQIILSKKVPNNPTGIKAEFEINETERKIIIKRPNFTYVFDKYTATFDSLTFNNVCYTTSPMKYNLWRAPTDNDRKIKEEWLAAGFDRTLVKVFGHKVDIKEDCVTIEYDFCITANIMQRIMELKTVFTIFSGGEISVSITAEKTPAFPELARFGIRMFLPDDFNTVNYKGYGPHESYSDKHNLCYYGEFDTSVTDMYEDYIVPQEHGSRYGCTEMSAKNAVGEIKVCADDFSFNVSDYTQETLTKTTHNFQLVKEGFKTLCIDYKNAGIGSSSCGQAKLDEKYAITENKIKFDFNIILN